MHKKNEKESLGKALFQMYEILSKVNLKD